MPMTHICITFHDFDSAHRNAERIAGCVALRVDPTLLALVSRPLIDILEERIG